MHDKTLRRTTNVEEVFPERAYELASMFNWTDLEKLNAGEWFLRVGMGPEAIAVGWSSYLNPPWGEEQLLDGVVWSAAQPNLHESFNSVLYQINAVIFFAV